MTPEEIRAEHARLMDRMLDAEREKKIVRAELEVLALRCRHPNQYGYTAMGEPGTKCPDCGKTT